MGKPHIIATFYNLAAAEHAFHDLLHIVPRDDISFVHRPDPEKYNENDLSSDTPLNGILIGTGIGGLGGVLAGLSMLLFPGIGIIMAAGPIYGALAGATAGGIIGGLMDLGVNKYEAEKIEEHIKGGAAMLTIEAPNQKAYQSITEILHHHGADYVSDERIVDDNFS